MRAPYELGLMNSYVVDMLGVDIECKCSEWTLNVWIMSRGFAQITKRDRFRISPEQVYFPVGSSSNTILVRTNSPWSLIINPIMTSTPPTRARTRDARVRVLRPRVASWTTQASFGCSTTEDTLRRQQQNWPFDYSHSVHACHRHHLGSSG